MSSIMQIQQRLPSKQSFPLRLFAAAFVISLLTGVFSGWQTWQIHSHFEEISKKHIDIEMDIGRIMLFDEVLTMSARMAAATEDFSYEKRYDEFDPQLTAYIGNLRADLPQPEIAQLIGETDEANFALVKMERQAFALAHQGRRQEATALLTSVEYMRLKKVYTGGMEKTVNAANELVEKETRQLHTLSLWLVTASAAGVLVLLATWFFAVRAARSWAAERRESEVVLSKSHDELESLVKQRTADLLGVNKQLQSEIAEHQRAEETLLHSEAGLARAQRVAHLGNWELDCVTKILSWSDEIYRIFEIDPNKFGASYEAFLNAVHPDDREFVNNAYIGSVKNHTSYNIEHRLRMPDGREKFVNEYCETFYDHSGMPLRSVGTVQDITERKLAEAKLAEQLDELQRWQLATSGREGRILEIKHEVNELLKKTGQPPRYPSAEQSDAE